MRLVEKREKEQERIIQKNLKEFNIDVIPKNKLDETFDKLTEELLTTDQMSNREYEQFIKKYLSYIVSRDGIKNCKLVYDYNKTKNDSQLAYTTPNSSNVYINPYQFNNANIKSIFKNISTLEHECQHLLDMQSDYKNVYHVNNTPTMFGYGFNDEFVVLNKFLDGKYKKELNVIKLINYYRDDMEIGARSKERIQSKKLIKNMQKVLSQNPNFDRKLAENNIKIMSDLDNELLKFENKVQLNYLQLKNNKLSNQPEMQNEITKKLQALELDNTIKKFTFKTLIKSLNMVGVANQQNFDLITEKFDYANLDCLDIENIFTLANQKNYEKANQVILNTYEKTYLALREKGVDQRMCLANLLSLNHDFQMRASEDKYSLVTAKQCQTDLSKISNKYPLNLHQIDTQNRTLSNENTLTKI